MYCLFLALCIFSRSRLAYHALKSLGILQLPTPLMLHVQIFQYSWNCEAVLLERAKNYEAYKEEQVNTGHMKPLGEGVLIWD